VQLRGSGDRDDPRLLREQPGERDLRRRRALALTDVAEQLDERQVRPARVMPGPVKRGTVLRKSPLLNCVPSSIAQ
jgi:hypothetical protein